MLLNLTGSTKANRDIATTAAVFAMMELGLTRLSSLDIDIAFKNLGEGSYGLCSVAETENSGRNKPMRSFIIEVNKTMNISMIVRTVLHEMVHVRQFARGQLDTTVNPKGIRWKSAHVNDDTVDYMDLPWEKEAHKLEEKLAAKFWSANLV
jgi:hypothetical protein